MRILYFTQFYYPENIAAAFRAKDHAAVWAAGGHDVTVFTGWPNYPTGELFKGYTMVSLGEETIDNVRVFRSRSKIQPNTSFKRRIGSGISYIVNGLRNLCGSSSVDADYDVVLVTSGTVFSAWLGVRYAKKHKFPLVVEFRDLTYKQMVATASSEKSFKVRFVKTLELSFCKAADQVVVLTEGFKQALAVEGISERKISVIPNGADVIPCEHRWTIPLRLGYFGTIGISQDVPKTLEYAAELVGQGLASEYLLIGEGAVRCEIEKIVLSDSYNFVTLMHGVSKDELEKYYASVDMTVVSLQKSESFAETIPSKIFQSFARGVPVLFIGPEGEAAHLVRESGGGVVLCGDRDEDLADFAEFANQPDLINELEEMSKSAIEFMNRNYTRRQMAEQMIDVFEQVDYRQNSIFTK